MNEPSQHKPCMPGCTAHVPAELEAEHLCLLHFTLSIEQACAEMRRETAGGKTSTERQAEISGYIGKYAVMLASAATGSLHLTDELRKRVLSTFLTLMVLRENLERAASRNAELEAAGSRTGIGLVRIA